MSAAPKTVKELIAILSEQDPDALVTTEGCDCVGPWAGNVDAYEHRGHKVVCINRDDSRTDY